MSNDHVDRLLSIWAESPDTRADVEQRYPGLAWAIEHVLHHEGRTAAQQMSDDTMDLYRRIIDSPRTVAASDPGLDTVSAVIKTGSLALALGRVDRITYHEDNTRPETDTDHTVMLGLVACAFATEHLPKLNVGRVAELALVHDVVEAYAGDVNTLHELDIEAKARKKENERRALERIDRSLGATLPWLVETIEDYEKRDEPEAIYVWAMDKLMPKITHMLNHGATLRDHGMTRDKLADRYDRQRVELKTRLDASAVDLSPVLTLRDALVDEVMSNYREDVAIHEQ